MVLFEPWIELVALTTLGCSLVALLVSICLVVFVLIAPAGNDKMQEICKAIRQGAIAFLTVEYISLSLFVLVMFVLISVLIHWKTGLCYFLGALCAAISGAIGMIVSTFANTRTTAAADTSMSKALRVAFNSGSVMGLSVVGCGLFGLSIIYLIFRDDTFNDLGVIAGFGMGATTLSFFARVGGGIFTKSADVGADLTSKIERGIPEDDPRNPATIADNVGDNVGDIAGMGADLNGSFIGSIIASALLGYTSFGVRGVAYPLWIGASGVFSSIAGMLVVRCRRDAGETGVLLALRLGLLVTNVLQIGLIAAITAILSMSWILFANIVIGLVAGYVIALNSEYFTSSKYRPTRSIAASSQTGAASVIIQGLSVGMISTIIPAIVLAATLLASLLLAGSYGVALASTGLLASLAFTLAIDAYGPVADNAGGIAEMARLSPHVRRRTDILDSIGNTTAAVGKGFAIASAVLTGFSLLAVFKAKVDLKMFDSIIDPYAVSGAIIGAVLPFLFASLTMNAVSKGATIVVNEVRRQFAESPGIMDHSQKPNYFRCVVLITAQSIHSMLVPGFLTIGLPLAAGLAFPLQFLAAFLMGIIIMGFLLAAMKASAGGAWDNAKKYIEAYEMYGGKKSDAHRAAVVGDTVGDPFKDTSGPAINIFIKLSGYMTVVLAPLYVYAQNAGLWWTAIIVLGVLFFSSAIINIMSPVNFMWVWNRYKSVPSEPASDGIDSASPGSKSEIVPIQSEQYKQATTTE